MLKGKGRESSLQLSTMSPFQVQLPHVQLFKLEISINNSSEISLNVQKGSLGAKEGAATAARASAYMIRFTSRQLQRLLATHSPGSHCLSILPPGHKNIVFLALDTKVNRQESNDISGLCWELILFNSVVSARREGAWFAGTVGSCWVCKEKTH